MTNQVVKNPFPPLGFSPSDHLCNILPEDFARDLSIAPLYVSGQKLIIAASRNLSSDEMTRLEHFTRYPVQAVQVSYLEVRRYQSRLYENIELQPESIPTKMILNFLDIDPHEQRDSELDELNTLNPSFLTKWLQRGWLTGKQWGELSSFSLGLPYKFSAESSPLNSLTHLILKNPIFRLTTNYFIPLCWANDTLFLGISDFTHISEIKKMTDQWHMKRSYVLIPPGLQNKLANSFDVQALYAEEINDEQIADKLHQDNLISSAELNAAKTLVNSAGIPLREAVIAGREELERRWLAELANLRNVLPIYRQDLSEHFQNELIQLVDHIPFEFCRLLSALPLNLADNILIVGLREIHPGVIQILEHVSGYQIEPRLMNDTIIQKWLRKANETLSRKPSFRTDLEQIKQFLLSVKFIQKDQLDRMALDDSISIPDFFKRLQSEGLIDDDDIAQIYGIFFQTPYCSLEHFHFDPELVNQFSQPFLKQQQILPLLQNKDDLWVATVDPMDGEKLAEVSKRSGCRVWPVIAPRSTIVSTIREHFSYVPSIKSALYLEECVDYLIDRGIINAVDKPNIIHDVVEKGRLFDRVIQENQITPQTTLYDVFAEFRAVPYMSLDPVKLKQELIDPLGNRIEQLRTQDPVNVSAARLLDYETARRLGALPVEILDSGVKVAFANPLFDKAQADLQSLFQENIYPCLTTRESLESAIERTLGRTNIGTLLMTSGLITRGQLNDALNLAGNTNTRIGRALIHRGFITEKQLYTFLSRQADMPLFDLSQMTLSNQASNILTPDEQWEHGVLPLSRDKETVILGVVDPISRDAIEYVEKKTGLDVKPVLITENDFENALEQLYQEHYTAQSISALLSREPENSAAKVLTRQQSIWLIIILVITIALAIWNLKSFLIVLNSIFTIIYMLMVVYKFSLVSASIGTDLEVPVSEEEIRALKDDELPIYTILIPVYKEAAVLPKLLTSITNLDYPKIKLDVKVLLEEDDEETIAAFKAINPPDYIQGVIVPTSLPKTKPKACNYGLIHARGEFVVIFDAEDQPDPDQLKRVLVAFNKIPTNVICIQVKLNYFNRNQNLLTRWFSIEYSMWFDLFLPGLDARKAPIPLGGTSNHFKKFALVEAGAWDPHNMTEDADLGIRLYKLGYRTRIVDTTTYEEANSKVNNWIRQRSRWVKGYIQTWLVHMRHPIKLIRDIGFSAFFSFQMVVGGNIFTVLINPIYWIITTVWLIFPSEFISTLFQGPVYYLSAFSLFFGNFAFTYINVAGAMSRGYYEMVRAALISPLYWGLMSIGGWKGFLQLITKPHYWEKTVHGLDELDDDLEDDEDFFE